MCVCVCVCGKGVATTATKTSKKKSLRIYIKKRKQFRAQNPPQLPPPLPPCKNAQHDICHWLFFGLSLRTVSVLNVCIIDIPNLFKL